MMRRNANGVWATVMAAVALFGVSALAGCGTEEPGMTCGPGTHDDSGQCVPDQVSGVDGGEDALVDPEGGNPGEGGPDGPETPEPPCATNDRCPTVGMVTVHWPNDEQPPYEIDAWETTVGEYDKFLEDVDAGVVVATDEPPCTADQAFVPEEFCVGDNMKGIGKTLQLDLEDPNKPVFCIAWCAARAYCEWAGKRLCGGSVSQEKLVGEWYNACSEGGTDPAGELKDPACTPAWPCEDAPGIFNMVGGVSEPLDTCDEATRECTSTVSEIIHGETCSSDNVVSANSPFGPEGVRCCR